MIELAFRAAGTGTPDARPLVLLHGWSCHGGFFRPQMEALGPMTRVIAPDLPGHGDSARTGDLTIVAAADAVARMLAAQALDDVVLVGWSMGALVAWSMIERHGTGRLARLVVEDMSPKVLNDADWPHGTRSGLDADRSRGFARAVASQWPRLAGATARRSFAPGAQEELISFAEAEMRKAKGPALAAMWASLTAQDFRPLIAKVEIPVTLAPGGQSQLYAGGAAKWQLERLQRGHVVPFPHSGHAPHLEEPEAFNALLSKLCRTA
ncbi:alpha/beta fold hydrolase [Stappia sp. ES.058]|uniref:alpha/beta fold hydrolase n=1 Tax=Stappia sp. ES.058 TaxID=1881061 RepID=UPI00087CF705|nr:alpha/beta hydrolase [Stappia sp. ES.058]SDT89726.1 Pimeloyl-ACP methyl ester carboxylesterase [Stappia sp. ES.058]